MPAKNFLNNLTVPSPCEADWDSMIGNDRMRFCEHCNLDVHNLSLLTRNQAERLVARSNGRLCIRYYHDARGKPSVLPVSQKLHRIGRRVSRIAAGAFTATLSVSSAIAQQPAGFRSHTGNPQEATQPIDRWTLTSSFAGTVKDQNDAVIPGATISVVSKKTAIAFYASSDHTGQFKVENLSAGSYEVRIEAPGFEAQEIQIFTVENAEVRVDSNLQVQSIQETVNVIEYVEFSGGAMVMVGPEDPFIRAAQEDDLETFTSMIAGRDVNLRDKESGTTALEHAVKNGNREMLQLLISAGVKVNEKNSAGETVLMMFDDDATSDLIWDLINAGADVNLKDDNGDTALMRAASVDNLDAVKALIEAGAKLNDRNKPGNTALMLAASEGHVNIVRALAIAGADINVIDEDGMNALGLARDNDHFAVVRFLKSKGAAEVVAKEKKEEEEE